MYEEIIENVTSESIIDVNLYQTSLYPIVLGKELHEDTLEVQLNITNNNKNLSVNPLLKEEGRASEDIIDQSELKVKNKENNLLNQISSTTTKFSGKRNNEGYTEERTIDYTKQTRTQIINSKTIESLSTTVEFLVKEEHFSSFNAALNVALPKGIHIKAPFTVFAPTNAAFAKISKPSLAWLLGNPAALSRVMKRHLSPGSRGC